MAEACAAVGISRQSAYVLKMRADAQGFRMAWDAAMDFAVQRLFDECYSRALNGEAIPHHYQGELVGEHRRYDNRLAMFLLRYRDPLRYAATLDQMVYTGHPEQSVLAFAKARDRAQAEAHGIVDTPVPAEPLRTALVAQERKRQRDKAVAAERVAAQKLWNAERAEQDRVWAEFEAQHSGWVRSRGAAPPDVASTSSTSAPPRPGG